MSNTMTLDISQRIEPIGYDVKRNAYWFIGGNIRHLWLRVLDSPPFSRQVMDTTLRP